MLISRFFNDLENIRLWADEEIFRANRSPEPFFSTHREAAISLQELTNKLYEFYYDEENGVYRYPSDEELEQDENKKSDYDDFVDLYQNFIQKADAYFAFVKEHEKEAKEEDIKIPSQLRMLYSYAKRDLWDREDQKEKDPILENSQALKNAREAIDAPTNMQELVQMEQEISDLINEIKEMEKEDPTLDKAPVEEISKEEEVPEKEEVPKKEETFKAEEAPKREEAPEAVVTEEEVESILAERLEAGNEKNLKKLTEEELNDLSEEEKKKRVTAIEKLRESIRKDLLTKRTKEGTKFQADLNREVLSASAALEKEIKKAIDKENKEKTDKEKEEQKLREEEQKLANQLKEEKEREKTEKAQKEEEERRERQEAEQKDNDIIKEASDKADQLLNNEMGDLLKEMQKVEKTILHVNSDEFKAMRDRLYELSDYIKQVKEENQGKDELDQESRKELQNRIDALEKSVDVYINAKGMGQQWSTRGKKRIDLAYSIGDYLTRVREASLEKYNALEQRELRRLKYEEANREKLEQLKREKEELEAYMEKSPVYGRLIHEMDKIEELKHLPGETFLQRQFKDDLERYMDLMREGADIAEVKLARAALKESRSLMMAEGAYKSIDQDKKNAIRRLDVFAPNAEKNIKLDVEKYRNDPDFFKEHLEEHKHIFDRLGEIEKLPLNVKNFINEYNEFINETNLEKLKPEYMELRLNYLYENLSSVANTIKKEKIELKRGYGHEPFPSKALESILRFGVRNQIKEMKDNLLGCSKTMMREAIGSKEYIKEFLEEYKDFMDEFCNKCPEAKEAREWLQEELDSDQINDNRLGSFFGSKLRSLITEKNINTYKVIIPGIDKKEISNYLSDMTLKMNLGRSFMIDSYKNETLALKQREGRKKIEDDLKQVKESENAHREDRKHLTDFYEEIAKGILEMNDGSSSFVPIMKTQEKLRDYVRTTKGTLEYGARIIVSSLRQDIASLERNQYIENKEKIKGTLDRLYNLCSDKVKFINNENARIAKEKRETSIRLEEEKKEREYYYRVVKAGTKENLPILEKEGLLKGYEEVVKELQDKLDERIKNPETMLQILNKTEEMIEEIAAHKMSEPAKDALKKFSQAVVHGLQSNYHYRAQNRWQEIKHSSIVSYCHYQKMAENDNRIGQRKMYAEDIYSMEILGWDTDCVEDESVFRFGKGIENMNEGSVWSNLKEEQMSHADATYAIDGLMEAKGLKLEDLSPEFQMMKRLFDCRKIVPKLKSVDHLRHYQPITSEDMVHDAKLVEMAKFATRILNKIEKYKGDDRQEFIKNSTSYITGMMDSFEKFLEEKYKDKKIYFFKNKPEPNLYKEWKEQQVKRREELKHQGNTLADLDEVKLLKTKEKIKQAKKEARQKDNNVTLEERCAIASKLKLPADVGIIREDELKAIKNEDNIVKQAKKLYSRVLRVNEERMKTLGEDGMKKFSMRSVMVAYHLYHQTTKGKKEPIAPVHACNTMANYDENFTCALGSIGRYCLSKFEKSSYSKDYIEHSAMSFAEDLKLPENNKEWMYCSYNGGVDLLFNSDDLGSDMMMEVGNITEKFQRIRSLSGGHVNAVKTIINLQKLRTGGSVNKLPVILALNSGLDCTIGECRDTYKKITMSQLGNKLLKDLNKMSSEQRKSYLEKEGGIERIEGQIKRLEKFLDRNMPDFLKAENDWEVDKKVMDKTMLLVSEDRFKEFLKEEKILEEKMKKETETVKEKEEQEMEASR